MHDNYLEPEPITVKPGEAIRFNIRNAGEFVHELSIGIAAMHAAHQDDMRMMVNHRVLGPASIDVKAARQCRTAWATACTTIPTVCCWSRATPER